MLSDKKFLHKTFPEKKISDIMILYVQKDPYIKTFPHRTFPDNILLEQLLPPANYLIRTWMDGQDEFVIEWKQICAGLSLQDLMHADKILQSEGDWQRLCIIK